MQRKKNNNNNNKKQSERDATISHLAVSLVYRGTPPTH